MTFSKLRSATEFVRANHKMFFRNGPGAGDCATYLAGDALVMGAKVVAIVRVERWWIVASDLAWLTLPGVRVADLFEEMTPFPAAGANSIRNEVLVGAYATDVAVYLDDAVERIRGAQQAPSAADVRSIVKNVRAAVAFIFPEEISD